jgi:hypothetical protein
MKVACNRRGDAMSTNDTYLAVFCGSKTSPRRAAWDALPETERRARECEGVSAWKAWVERHQNAIWPWAGRGEKRRHPHFTIFPGDSVEIMPVLPIPNA